MRPHRRQPTRLPRPWDSPGKNSGVGCHFLLQWVKVKSEREVAQSCPTLSDPMELLPTGLLHPWDFPGKSIGVGCHCLLRTSCLIGKLIRTLTQDSNSWLGPCGRAWLVQCPLWGQIKAVLARDCPMMSSWWDTGQKRGGAGDKNKALTARPVVSSVWSWAGGSNWSPSGQDTDAGGQRQRKEDVWVCVSPAQLIPVVSVPPCAFVQIWHVV